NFQKQKQIQKHIKEVTKQENHFPYDLKNPDHVYNLPAYLEEISGISSYKKNKIACIQDEKANIYIFDTKKRKVNLKFDFGKDGDFEDIAIVEDNVFVLRSDGTLFKIENFETVNNKTTKINTSLNNENDTEGLFFDNSTNSLLIACKGVPSINSKELYAGFKAIYRFDLKNNSLIEKPAYLVDLSKTDNLRRPGVIGKFFTETAKKLKLTDEIGSFHPSGIAIHPIDKENIYIISSIGQLLIIMNRQEKIMSIIELDKRLFNQPEGICFSENGDMFISNEGKNGGGNILKFKITTDFHNKK
ncbi:MAG: hypothetical protein V3R52_06530, partial [Candidatus Neomarinimicrobiota bacterium]